MKLSLTVAATEDQNYPALLKGDLAGNIRRAARWGFEAVELHLADPSLYDWPEMAAIAGDCGVEITSFGTGLACRQDRLSFTDPGAQRREAAVARVALFLDAARVFKAPVIIGSIRGSVPRPEEAEKYGGYLVDSLQRCLELAEKAGVDLVIEAINRYETNLLNSAAEAMALLAKIGSPRLKLHLDTFHMNIEEADLGAAIRDAAGCLGHIHLADSNRRYPGSGHLDFAAIVKALKAIGYRGAAALEYLPWPAAEEAALRGKAHLEPLLRG